MNPAYYISKLFSSLFRAGKLLLCGHFGTFYKEARLRIHSKTYTLGLRRDLTKEFPAPTAKVDFSIRPLENRDITELLSDEKLINEEPRLESYLKKIILSGIPTCYVAVDNEDRAMYMQFLIGPAYNDQITEVFGNKFPKLKPHEVLLEAAFTGYRSRGLRVMPAAMSKIAEKGLELGAIHAITFVDHKNLPSLKGCHRCGFEPYIMRVERWMLFSKSTTFSEIPESFLERYRNTVVEPVPTVTSQVDQAPTASTSPATTSLPQS